jgi:hypothetical protein
LILFARQIANVPATEEVKKMETILLSVALVRKLDDRGGVLWMGRKNPATGSLKFVVGQPSGPESLREAVTEAIVWELGLDRKKDFIVSSMAQLNFDFPDSVPAVRGNQPLRVSFYNIELYRRDAMKLLDDDPNNVWLTSEEIWDGRSADGLVLDPMVQQLVTQSEVIRSWESSAGRE